MTNKWTPYFRIADSEVMNFPNLWCPGTTRVDNFPHLWCLDYKLGTTRVKNCLHSWCIDYKSFVDSWLRGFAASRLRGFAASRLRHSWFAIWAARVWKIHYTLPSYAEITHNATIAMQKISKKS
jgi:hypothetical protein